MTPQLQSHALAVWADYPQHERPSSVELLEDMGNDIQRLFDSVPLVRELYISGNLQDMQSRGNARVRYVRPEGSMSEGHEIDRYDARGKTDIPKRHANHNPVKKHQPPIVQGTREPSPPLLRRRTINDENREDRFVSSRQNTWW